MGYDLHITRREDWSDEDSSRDISQAEWLAYVAAHPEWKIGARNGLCFANWLGGGQPEDEAPWIDWFQGNLYSKYPPPEMIVEMIRIAKHFGAKVQGDEGEIYETQADIDRYAGDSAAAKAGHGSASAGPIFAPHPRGVARHVTGIPSGALDLVRSGRARMTSRFNILHAAWVIQDGNYDDWSVGQRVRFALEYGGELSPADAEETGLHPIDETTYRAVGRPVFVHDREWIVDFGDVLAYGHCPQDALALLGKHVKGKISLLVDHFEYFERLAKLPGVPALIYEWTIDRILMEAAPYIDGSAPGVGRCLVRDPSKLSRVPIQATDGWQDDGGNGDYLLVCEKHPVAPSTRL